MTVMWALKTLQLRFSLTLRIQAVALSNLSKYEKHSNSRPTGCCQEQQA